jgi:hypothetical protein
VRDTVRVLIFHTTCGINDALDLTNRRVFFPTPSLLIAGGKSIRSSKSEKTINSRDMLSADDDDEDIGLASMHSIRDHHAYQSLNADGGHLVSERDP